MSGEEPVSWGFGDMPDQSGRVAVITGASSGLGRIAAAQLAAHGATVVLAVRDVAKGERVRADLHAATGGDLTVRELDLADLTSVRRFADRLHADHAHLDVLLNNAGLGTQERQLTPQGYELTFATNHLGHFALTGLLLDLFRPGHDPRVVTVGSGLYRWARTGPDLDDLTAAGSFTPGGAYARSKAANLLFGAELERRLRAAGSPVRSLLAHPGMAATPMNRTARGLVQTTLRAVGGALVGRSAARGVIPLLFAATAPAAETGVFLGPSLRKWDSRVHFTPLVAPATDRGLARRLWSVSEAATGVSYLPVIDAVLDPANPA